MSSFFVKRSVDDLGGAISEIHGGQILQRYKPAIHGIAGRDRHFVMIGFTKKIEKHIVVLYFALIIENDPVEGNNKVQNLDCKPNFFHDLPAHCVMKALTELYQTAGQ